MQSMKTLCFAAMRGEEKKKKKKKHVNDAVSLERSPSLAYIVKELGRNAAGIQCGQPCAGSRLAVEKRNCLNTCVFNPRQLLVRRIVCWDCKYSVGQLR